MVDEGMSVADTEGYLLELNLDVIEEFSQAQASSKPVPSRPHSTPPDQCELSRSHANGKHSKTI